MSVPTKSFEETRLQLLKRAKSLLQHAQHMRTDLIANGNDAVETAMESVIAEQEQLIAFLESVAPKDKAPPNT
jgi:hypothetical protein